MLTGHHDPFMRATKCLQLLTNRQNPDTPGCNLPGRSLIYTLLCSLASFLVKLRQIMNLYAFQTCEALLYCLVRHLRVAKAEFFPFENPN